MSNEGGRAASGKVGVDVHIASHDSHHQGCALLAHDTGAKVLKIQVLNSLDTRDTLLTLL
jgi:hypothetical protein